jgi:hypothetical protein
MKDYYTPLKNFLEKHFPAQVHKLDAIRDNDVEVIKMYNTWKRAAADKLQERQESADTENKSQEVAKGIDIAINNVDESLHYGDFAKAVAFTLRENYGTHNIAPFMKVLHAELGMNESLKEITHDQAIAKNSSSNLMTTLTNGGKLAKPTGGVSMNGKYYQLQGGTKQEVIHFDYDSTSEKPFGIVQVAGHHMPTQLLGSLGFRETRSWTSGVEVYIFDGNYSPKYISEKAMAQLVEEWDKGISSYYKQMGDFYRDKGRTSGTIDEAKATCCHRCGRVHVKGTPCKKPYLKGKESCAINEIETLKEFYSK